MNAIDTGDSVLHRPTGETWLVAIVEGDRLYWCGWPPGSANLADCELKRKATPEQALKLLRELSEMQPDEREGWDARKSLAISRLAALSSRPARGGGGA